LRVAADLRDRDAAAAGARERHRGRVHEADLRPAGERERADGAGGGVRAGGAPEDEPLGPLREAREAVGALRPWGGSCLRAARHLRGRERALRPAPGPPAAAPPDLPLVSIVASRRRPSYRLPRGDARRRRRGVATPCPRRTAERPEVAEPGHPCSRPSSTPERHEEYRDREYEAAERLGRSVGEGCHALYPDCRTSFLDVFSRVRNLLVPESLRG
jgi:hypothetical protein